MGDRDALQKALDDSAGEVANLVLDSLLDKYCADGLKDMGTKPLPSAMMGSICSLLSSMALRAMEIELQELPRAELDRHLTTWVSTLLGTIARDLEQNHGIRTKIFSKLHDKDTK